MILGTASPATGQVVGVYTDLPLGTPINLTSAGPTDWVKWGINGGAANWTSVSKVGVPPLISRGLAPLGTPPQGTAVVLIGIAANQSVLNFVWTDGTGPGAGASDTIVTETILPAQFDYPLGLGAAMSVPASSATRVLDVYVQGFNADMLISATLSGGANTAVVVAPTKNPPADPSNNYAAGRYRVTFAGAGQTLTVSVRTISPVRPGGVRFPNAGFFAATLSEASTPGTPLAAPTNFAAQTNGLLVNFSWGASTGASSYQLEAGSGPGLSNLFTGDIGGGTSFSATGPVGTYFARLRARAGGTLSPPSNEIIFTLGSSGPCVAPGPPSNLTFTKAGTNLTVTWTGGAGATTYRLLAGTAPGASNAFDGNVGGATSQTFNVVGIPAGVYYVRVLSINACGNSGASNEVAIPLP